MAEEAIHPLRQWRLEHKFSLEDAARLVGAVRTSWFDWETRRRIPDRNFMNRIYLVTRGAVTADRFYWPYGYPVIERGGSDRKRDDFRGAEVALR